MVPELSQIPVCSSVSAGFSGGRHGLPLFLGFLLSLSVWSAPFAVMPDFEQSMRPPGDNAAERQTSLNNFVAGFNLDLFMRDLKATGAGTLVWMTGHQRWGYFFSPNRYYEKINPGWCAKRDLTMEIARKCRENGIRFQLAIPASMGPTQYQPAEVEQSFRYRQDDLTEYRNRYEEFVYDFLERYEEVLDGVVFIGSFPEKYTWFNELANLCRGINPDMVISMEVPEGKELPAGVIRAETLLRPQVEGFAPPARKEVLLIPLMTNPVFNGRPYDYATRYLKGVVRQSEQSGSQVTFVIPIARRGKLLPSVIDQLGGL